MDFRLVTAPAVLAVAALALAGCSVSISTATVSADSLASQAADALFEQTQDAELPPEVDCGNEDIRVAEGLVVDCLLTDPVNGLEYDLAVTLSDVDGSDFHISMKVAAEPNNAPTPESTGDALTVPSATLADLAAGALEPELGYAPTVICTDADVPLIVGESIRCMTTGGDVAATVLITITEVEGTRYAINAKIQ